MHAAAIIAAGGAGKRFGGTARKQYTLLAGRPVLAWTLHPFIECGAVHEIVLVVPEEDIEYCSDEILPVRNRHKSIQVVAGGQTRQDSVANGLRRISGGTEIVLVHDGARPFVTVRAIESGISECGMHGAVIYAVPETDSIIEVSDQTISSYLERERVWRVQTPQIFLRSILVTAFDAAARSGRLATDESALVRSAGFEVRVLEGAHDNIKITLPEDLKRAECIIRQRSDLAEFIRP